MGTLLLTWRKYEGCSPRPASRSAIRTSWSQAEGSARGIGLARCFLRRRIPTVSGGILHVIGERPGTIHHAYSLYITVTKGTDWAQKKIDHDVSKLVSNIADTALPRGRRP